MTANNMAVNSSPSTNKLILIKNNGALLKKNTDQTSIIQQKQEMTSTVQLTNDWLGNLMVENNFNEFNAFFDSNYNNYIQKGISYCNEKQIGEDLTKVGNVMEENKLLEFYIKKVDQDQSGLRADIRASEQRTSDKISSVEERMDARLNRIEDMISKSNENFNENIKSVGTKIESVESKIDSKLEAFRGDLKEHKFFRITSAIGIIGVCLATIGGIATMVVTIILQ